MIVLATVLSSVIALASEGGRAALAGRSPVPQLPGGEAPPGGEQDPGAARAGRAAAAEALVAEGRHAEALAAWREAQRLDSGDPWAIIGEANALVRLGQAEAARDALGRLPADASPDVRAEGRRAEGRAWRLQAEEAQARGDVEAARKAWEQAEAADPGDPWLLLGYGGFLLAEGSGGDWWTGGAERDVRRALEQYTAAERVFVAARAGGEAMDAAAGWALAVRGQAGALEILGRPQEALGKLVFLAERDPSAEHRRAAEALASRILVEEVRVLVAGGDLDGAERLLGEALRREAAGEGTTSADLQAAAAQIAADRGRAEEAVGFATRALAKEPGNRWAQQVLVSAARAARQSAEAVAILGVVVEKAPSAAASLALAEARVDAELEAARGGHRGEAMARVEAAEAIATEAERAAGEEAAGDGTAGDGAAGDGTAGDGAAPGSADVVLDGIWTRIADAWMALGRPGEAEALYVRRLAEHPDDVDLLLARSRAQVAMGRLRDAERGLEAAWVEREDPRLAEALTAVQVERGLHGRIAERQTASGGTPPERATDAGGRMGTVWVKSGARDGVGALDIQVVPVEVAVQATGLVHFGAGVDTVRVSDTTGDDTGVAPSVAFGTPDGRSLALAGRFGSSPLGFEGGAYPTWDVQLAARAAPRLTLGLQTGRTPRADSRASWAGEVYGPTGQVYGRVSQVWAGGTAAWSTPDTSLGILARGGYVEGIGVPPNPTGEAVGWAVRALDGAASSVGLEVGAVAVAQTYARREDGFAPGEGGYFSPSLFALALGRADMQVSRGPQGGARRAVCLGVAGGPQYVAGVDAREFYGPGLGAVGVGHLGLATTLSPGRGPRAVLALDGRAQAGTDGWHQVAVSAFLTVGPSAVPGAPAFGTLATAGLPLPSVSDLCTPDPA